MSSGDDAIRLLARADDAANTRSANRAILETFEEGLVRNVSVMATGPELDHAAELLADLDGLCAGLHVTLTAEWDRPRWGPVLPPAEVPTLVDDDGHLPPHPRALARRQPAVDELLAETRAQLERLRDAGFDVAYFDDHMRHRGTLLYEAPGYVTGLAELADGEGLIDGQTVRPRLPYPDGDPVPSHADELLGRLDAAEPGERLAVGHPGYYGEETRRITGGRADRGPGEWAATMDGQRRMFTDERVLDYCDAYGVTPIRYTELSDGSRG